jgi:hypothetical protein
MRALAHPVRIALIEELVLGGAMTATEAADRIGESPTTCSFHLRQLAKYGFVEEAGGGKGRSRPWRMTSVGLSFTTNPEDVEFQLATNAVLQIFRERQSARYQTWIDTRAAYSPRWRAAAGESTYILYVTADELEEVNDELRRILLPRYVERMTNPASRPPGSVAVELTTLSYPVGIPSADAGAGQETDQEAGPEAGLPAGAGPDNGEPGSAS